jgi:transcriptional regulator with XRE-family HTH domain
MDIYTELRNFLQTEYAKGATDQEIADRLGCSQQQVNHLRNGKRSFSKMRLETLLKLFPKLSIALDGVALHGNAIGTVNGNGNNIVTAHDSQGNVFHLTTDGNLCQDEVESFRGSLLQGVLDLDIDDTSKVAILRFVRDHDRAAASPLADKKSPPGQAPDGEK